jgi:predicted transposase/invertase (TIGR01784 family)
MAKQQRKQSRKGRKKAVNLHDAFFKNTFSYKDVAQTYLQKFMPNILVKNIDLESLTLENTSFIDNHLSEHFSDLVWNATYKKTIPIKIAFLFEHKSYVVAHPHFQLLRYLLEHWIGQEKKKEKLTIVIPIILYHGKEEWKMRSLFDYFEGLDDVLKAFIPNFEYHLTDLSAYNDDALLEMGIGKLLNIFLAMRHIRNVNYIKENFDKLFIYAESYIKNEEGKNFLYTLFVYLLKNNEFSGEDIEHIVTKVNEPIKDFTMSTYDQLIAKGKFEGKLEGKIEGKIEADAENEAKRRATIRRSLLKGLSVEFIAEIHDVSLDYVQAIKVELES